MVHSSNDNYGASKVLISTIDIFIKNKFKVYLILPNNGPLNSNAIIKKTNLKIINLGVFRKKYFNFFGLISRIYYIIKSSFQIKNYLKNNNIDLVYTNTSTLLSPSIAAKIVGIPSIYHIHEIPKSSSIYAKFIALFLNNFSTNIICVSKSVKEFWFNCGVKKNKLKIIYNGFIFKQPIPKKQNKEKIIFTSVSRIIPYKGHKILIELFKILCKKNSKIHLQIIGDTLPQYQKYFDDLKLYVNKIELSDRIKFLNFRDDVKSILEKSCFFIHTPISPDPFPTVIFEAIETKTPVITNNQGGSYEILNKGENALIINNDRLNESVEKIILYIKNKEKYKKDADRAFNYICQNFSLEKFKRKIIGTIE
ncbi:glycosyltransferase family 4 protein [Flavobacteriales bacterium]|nr:glycosyltransferase family 4 protein [Flavobacteriales bacterium]